MNKLADAEANPLVADLCPAGIKLFRALAAAQGDSGLRLQSTFVSTIMAAR